MKFIVNTATATISEGTLSGVIHKIEGNKIVSSKGKTLAVIFDTYREAFIFCGSLLS